MQSVSTESHLHGYEGYRSIYQVYFLHVCCDLWVFYIESVTQKEALCNITVCNFEGFHYMLAHFAYLSVESSCTLLLFPFIVVGFLLAVSMVSSQGNVRYLINVSNFRLI